MTTFLCDKILIDSRQFKIEDVRQFSMNNNIKVIIPNFAIIINGEIEYIDKRIN